METVSTILGAIVSSSVVSALLTLVINTRQQERATLRSKLEELTSILNRQLVMMKNQLTYVEHSKAGLMSETELAARLEADAEIEIPHDRVQALLFIYFPELVPHIAKIVLLQQQMKPAQDQYTQTKRMFEAHNEFFGKVLKQGASVNKSLWKIWE
jgi:hypothetical protein